MKKALFWLSIAYLMFQSAPVWAQTIDVPFEIKKTGTGNQSLIFIPGFASSVTYGKQQQLILRLNLHVILSRWLVLRV
ncbi:hypothetical protein QW060_26775 [Myroides ceti]|uniref:Uncharacterized protein n=1 Tax=Paenimyroides ceti TaxID=395087 RepID=A0ABT8D5A5_9FLAO|nr:hypothetical protein [Paenimyroides ceti]MDN3710402.1 hypothetical protein [Paenimyroides ceti]MDN3710424.1 hypothetical protein [Paenimyroides ceti]